MTQESYVESEAIHTNLDSGSSDGDSRYTVFDCRRLIDELVSIGLNVSIRAISDNLKPDISESTFSRMRKDRCIKRALIAVLIRAVNIAAFGPPPIDRKRILSSRRGVFRWYPYPVQEYDYDAVNARIKRANDDPEPRIAYADMLENENTELGRLKASHDVWTEGKRFRIPIGPWKKQLEKENALAKRMREGRDAERQ